MNVLELKDGRLVEAWVPLELENSISVEVAQDFEKVPCREVWNEVPLREISRGRKVLLLFLLAFRS